MEQFKFRTAFYTVAAALLALILWLLFGSGSDRSPVPTFVVSSDTIVVKPDRNFGADQVEITISGTDGAQYLSKMYALDSLEQGVKFAVPESFKGSKKSIKFRQRYFKKGRPIKCCGTDETILEPGGGTTGTPLIGLDVVVQRNNTPMPTTAGFTNYCDCPWGPTTTYPAVSSVNPYIKEVDLQTYAGPGEERFLVTITNTAGGAGSTSKFILTRLNATTVQYLTAANFSSTCALGLSSVTNFCTDGKMVSYNSPLVYYSFQVYADATGPDARRLIIFCPPAPLVGSTPPGYTITVQKGFCSAFGE